MTLGAFLIAFAVGAIWGVIVYRGLTEPGVKPRAGRLRGAPPVAPVASPDEFGSAGSHGGGW